MKPAPTRATLWAFVIYFFKLGTLGFGGPIALAGYMQRDVPTVLICAVTFAVIVSMKRVPEPALIAASGVVGLLLKHAL
ncbi:MAG TPA: hypothetical protein VEK78_13795 [Gemmatimonadales bacterium]|nr:hypothetical protein [Gemmatimonadales bacterium]